MAVRCTTSTLILQHCIKAGWLPRLTTIPRRLSPTARDVGLVLFTPTALRRGDRIDHTNQQETGPETDLKASSAQLSHAKQLRGNGSLLQQWCLQKWENSEPKGLEADVKLQKRDATARHWQALPSVTSMCSQNILTSGWPTCE